jgi:hypothetical protein
MAFHRLRLDTNWARPFPEGSVTSIQTEGKQVVAVVPATDIIIVFKCTSVDRTLLSYDTKTEKQTFKLDLPVGTLIYAISAPLQAKGEYRIALQMQTYAVVICTFSFDDMLTYDKGPLHLTSSVFVTRKAKRQTSD